MESSSSTAGSCISCSSASYAPSSLEGELCTCWVRMGSGEQLWYSAQRQMTQATSCFTQTSNWFSKTFFTGCLLPEVVTQDPELPRIWHSAHFSLGSSPAGWGEGHTPLPGVDEKLPSNSSTFQYFSLLCAPRQTWEVTAAGVQQLSLVWGSTAKRHLLPMSQPLSSQHNPAASGLIWLHTYQICFHLYCREAQLQGSE